MEYELDEEENGSDIEIDKLAGLVYFFNIFQLTYFDTFSNGF